MKPKLSQFDFELPSELLAKKPLLNRDDSKMMVLHRESGEIEHKKFKDILDYFEEDDVMVLNNTKVIPARLYGNKEKTGAKIVAVPVDNDGCFNIKELKDRVTKNTKIISVPHVSNVLGTIFPVKEISAIAKPDLIQNAPGLPKTRSGKIMRRILRKIAENDLSNLGDTTTLADPTVVESLINNKISL